jgi:hypothetical protein
MQEEQLYILIGRNFTDAQQSQMFGKPCFKINGKAFISFFENGMVFKLTGNIHQEALSLDGSKLFDPSKKGRPMKEWVWVSYEYRNKWKEFAAASYEYLKAITL